MKTEGEVRDKLKELQDKFLKEGFVSLQTWHLGGIEMLEWVLE